MSKQSENRMYRVKTDGFHGELFLPHEDQYPGKVLICFSGSDGKFELPVCWRGFSRLMD